MVSKAESEAQYTECQTNDSPVEYNCKISRQKIALTDTLIVMVSSSRSSSSRSRSSYRHPRPACKHAAINQQARRLGGAERGATADNRDVPGTSGLPCQVTVQWAGSTPRSTLDVECQSSSRNVTSRR